MIALDGADAGLLARGCADGSLPALARLRARGTVASLHAPAGVTDDGWWASFQYAQGLGEHGRYFHSQRLRSGRIGMAYLDETGRASFWHALSAHGLRVAVLDIPKCGPPRELNGIHLVDWLVHGRYLHAPASHPPEIAAQVLERFGAAPPSRCGVETGTLDDAGVHDTVANLRAGVARKRAAAAHYLGAGQWDLFLVGFKAAHCACHQLWDLADPRHPGHDPLRTARLGDPMHTLLAELDAAIGELVDAAGAGCELVVFSTSAMAPNGSLVHLMPGIVSRVNAALGERPLARALRRLARVPGGRPCEILPYNENCTALRIHPPRRSPRAHGAAIADEVASMLRELVDADTGEAVIEFISRPSEEHAGQAHADELPDLLVACRPGTMPRAVRSARLGRIEAARPALRPGNHAGDGIAIGTPAVLAGLDAAEDFGVAAARVLGAPAPCR